MAERYKFELFPDRTLTLLLFTELNDTASLASSLQAKALPCALLTPELVLEPLQILIAANMALDSKKRNSLLTKDIHSELGFYLAASKNINRSLKRFGLEPNMKSLLVAMFDASDDQIKEIRAVISGKEIPLSRISELSDVKKIKEWYNISDKALIASSLLEVIISSISTCRCKMVKEKI
eukprot:TRINITY_DN10420_c0_g1_i1.p1 TRINITY_DN10420_c0_g1~~TRINITY_DN10420_c0_g1_i1.p1  ORF type:complete len:180 (-),score=17.77 TRINITY_DN10420_c0_g1_i1:3-542(-)